MAQLSHLNGSTIFRDRIHNDPHSTLYYGLIYQVSRFFGDGESLRILSVMFSILALGVFYQLSRLFFNQKVSVYALLVMAISPVHIWYAQEARVYSLAVFLTLSMVYLFIRALNTDQWRYWIGFSILGVLSLFATYYAVFLLSIFVVAMNFKDNKPKMKKWFLAMVIMAAVSSFYLPVFSSQVSFVKEDFWLPSPTPGMFLFTWMIFSLGYSAGIIQYSIGLVIFLILFFWGFYVCFNESRTKAVLILLLGVAPIILIYFLSLKVIPLYINRQLLIFSPYYFLLIAKGIEGITSKKDQNFVVICILLLQVSCLYNYYRNYMFDHPARALYFTGVVPKKNYWSQFDYVKDHFKKGDRIVVTDTQAYVMVFSYLLKHSGEKLPLSFEQFRFFMFPKLMQRFDNRFLKINALLRMIPQDKIDQMQVFVPLPNGTMLLMDDSTVDQNFERVWLIIASWHNDGVESKILGLNSQNVRRYMDMHYTKTLKKTKDGVYVELYEK
ncbi:MAG: glycosyltransferase family 39 protein [Candidatus Omnitrophota bacterium]